MICGSSPTPSATTTEPLTTVTTSLHVSHASSFALSMDSTSVAYTSRNADGTISSNTTTVGFNSLSMESTQGVPDNMICKYAF